MIHDTRQCQKNQDKFEDKVKESMERIPWLCFDTFLCYNQYAVCGLEAKQRVQKEMPITNSGCCWRSRGDAPDPRGGPYGAV